MTYSQEIRCLSPIFIIIGLGCSGVDQALIQTYDSNGRLNHRGQVSDPSTKQRLLDTAERLYAEQGIDATSLRAITAEARTNLAAVHYHFGSKQALTEAVFSRRILPINRKRLRSLDRLEEEANGRPVPVESIVGVFIRPALEVSREHRLGGDKFIRLIGRIYTEPGGELGNILKEQFQEIMKRFGEALGRTLPHLEQKELIWRFHFMVGTLVHTIADPAKIHRLSGGLCDPDDVEGVSARLVAFITGGLAAPLPTEMGGAP